MGYGCAGGSELAGTSLGEQMPCEEPQGVSVSVPAWYPDVQNPSGVWS